MTITLGNIFMAQPVLSKLNTMSFRGRKAFIIAKLVKALAVEMEEFNAARDAILMKYADRDENDEVVINDGQVHLTDENLTLCNKEIQELLSTEVEINCSLMNIDWFEEIDITPSEVNALMPFIEDEE